LKSWTVFYSVDGYEYALSVDGETLEEIEGEAKKVLAYLKRNRAKPSCSRPIPPKPHRIVPLTEKKKPVTDRATDGKEKTGDRVVNVFEVV